MIAPVALITGGERGIGRGIAETLLRRGYRVLIAGVDEQAAEEALPDLKQLGEVHFCKCDVGRPDPVRSCIEWIRENWGRLDGLVCNAAHADPARKPIGEVSLDEWQEVIRTNLTGAFLCAQAAAPLLGETNGAIVLIASSRAYQSEPNTFAYSATKGGIVALTHSLAISLGPKVRANAIAPGWIQNEDYDQLRDIDHAQHPVGRVGTPHDIATLCAFLLSPDAGFITGQDFVADGGMTRKMIYAY
ncbi:MAG: short-chain dehydrogenase/reductase SDR [Puniceicoccaceae bacterium 5H]|nr:MAG: short-chain dehydrogenase/reductase SDR [Puniceicoccaceae bacterium 5H]